MYNLVYGLVPVVSGSTKIPIAAVHTACMVMKKKARLYNVAWYIASNKVIAFSCLLTFLLAATFDGHIGISVPSSSTS